MATEPLQNLIRKHGRFFPCFTYKNSPLFPEIEKSFSREGAFALERERLDLTNREAAFLMAVFGRISKAIAIAEECVSPAEVPEYIGRPPSIVSAYRSKKRIRKDAKLSKSTLKGALKGDPFAIQEARKCL